MGEKAQLEAQRSVVLLFKICELICQDILNDRDKETTNIYFLPSAVEHCE